MKKQIAKLALGAALFIAALALKGEWLKLAFFIAAYLVIGGEVLLKALRNILHGEIFDENFLMCIATAGAFAVGQYPEAVSVMFFYMLGELFTDLAVGRSERSISALMDIRPDHANLITESGRKTVAPEEVSVGDMIAVLPGERIPLDGSVAEGLSYVDTSSLTGESVPREVSPGSRVYAGCVNKSGLLTVKVSKPASESAASRILELVKNASEGKSRQEAFITRFARVYTPAVVISAAALAFIPPLCGLGSLASWVYRALTFLVVSCPCALVISVPLSFFGGIGGASKKGILIKGGAYLEALAKTGTVAFDKTGTLTEGVFEVTSVFPEGWTDEKELLELAAKAESASSHPISASIRRAAGDPDTSDTSDIHETAGRGVSALIGGRSVLVGSARLMADNGIAFRETAGTAVHAAVDGRYAGCMVISDRIKPDTAGAISTLRSMGIRTVMLTGDDASAAAPIAEALGIDEFRAGLLPEGKVDELKRLKAETPAGRTLAFVGDGINDAPVLAGADVGIAMGALGSDAAIEASDVVIMNDELSRIPAAIEASSHTLRIAMQNIVFALVIKAAVLVLGALGISGMWEAVFADVGVALLAVLNAMRAMRVK